MISDIVPKRRQSLIAVMGITGVGKTYFISKATGQDLALGNSLESSTTKIQQYKIRSEDRNIILLDTPGFDDGQRQDIDILEEFVRYLNRLSADGLSLAGIIYLHRITDNRMLGSAQRNIRLLDAMCGDDFLKHVILVTTMWDCTEESIAFAREDTLRNNYWKPLIEKKATTERFGGEKTQAREIIRKLLEHPPSDGITLDVLRESHNQTSVSDTKAGRVLLEDKFKKLQEFDRELNSLRETQKEMQKKIRETDQSEINLIRREIAELETERNRLWSILEKYNSDTPHSTSLEQEENPGISSAEAQIRPMSPSQRGLSGYVSGGASFHEFSNKPSTPRPPRSPLEGSRIPSQRQGSQSRPTTNSFELDGTSSPARFHQATASEDNAREQSSTSDHPLPGKPFKYTRSAWNPEYRCWSYNIYHRGQWVSGWCSSGPQQQSSPPNWRYHDPIRGDSQNPPFTDTSVYEGTWQYTFDGHNWNNI